VHDIHGDHRHIGMIYFARASSSELRLAPEEHHAIRWYSSEELNDPANSIDEAIRFYATEALERVSE
jgi:hypothetical protein